MINAACSDSIEPVLEMLEGKWTLLLLRDLFNGVKRFGELRRSLDPISPKTLTDRLRMLEEQGILTRTLFSEVPLHVEYELTERGQRLQPIFAAMKAWIEPDPAWSRPPSSCDRRIPGTIEDIMSEANRFDPVATWKLNSGMDGSEAGTNGALIRSLSFRFIPRGTKRSLFAKVI